MMNMTPVRALCPVTCGCATIDAPAAGYFASPTLGCPRSCEASMKSLSEAKAAFTGLPCVDATPEQFSSDEALIKYFAGVQSFFTTRAEMLLRMKTMLTFHYDRLRITAEMVPHLLHHIENGGLFNATMNGVWEIDEGVPHPRGLRGCAFWTSWEIELLLGIHVCDHATFRSLRPYCPVACGCQSAPGGSQCPRSCSVAASLRIT